MEEGGGMEERGEWKKGGMERGSAGVGGGNKKITKKTTPIPAKAGISRLLRQRREFYPAHRRR